MPTITALFCFAQFRHLYNEVKFFLCLHFAYNVPLCITTAFYFCQVSELNDNLELVKFVAGLESLVFSPKPLFKAKDEAESAKRRALGNDCFQKREYHQACLHYTISVIRAKYPKNNEKVKIIEDFECIAKSGHNRGTRKWIALCYLCWIVSLCCNIELSKIVCCCLH